jgi:hypothetical protein
MAQGVAPRVVIAALLAAALSLTACSGSSPVDDEAFNLSSDSPTASPTPSTSASETPLPAVPGSGAVIGVPTRTTLGGSAATVLAGTKLTLKASVRAERGITRPTGSVSFVDGAKVLATVRLALGRSSSSAVLTTSLPAGAHHLVARYGGDRAAAPSASVPITITAIRSVTTITIVVKPKANHPGRFRLAIDVRGRKPGPAGSGVVSIYVDGRLLLARLDANGHTFVDVRVRVGHYHSVVVTYAGNALLTPGRATRSFKA